MMQDNTALSIKQSDHCSGRLYGGFIDRLLVNQKKGDQWPALEASH